MLLMSPLPTLVRESNEITCLVKSKDRLSDRKKKEQRAKL